MASFIPFLIAVVGPHPAVSFHRGWDRLSWQEVTVYPELASHEASFLTTKFRIQANLRSQKRLTIVIPKENEFIEEMYQVDMSTLAHMLYLNARLNEALRLFPPALSGAQRSGLPGTGGTVVGTLFIPDRTQVFIHTYTFHRNPSYFFPFPETFLPDRWLPRSQRVYPLRTDPITHPIVLVRG